MGVVPGRRAAGLAIVARLLPALALVLVAAGSGPSSPPVATGPAQRTDLPDLLRDRPAGVVEAYVDQAAQRLVLTPAPGAGAELSARYAHDARIVVAPEREPARRASSLPAGGAGWAGATTAGGAPLTGDGRACTLGFTGTRGGLPVFLTAGHCGAPGTEFVSRGAVLGVVEHRVFPERDYALGVLTSGYGSAVVRSADGVDIPVRGSATAPVGERVCTLGATSGWSCGTVLAHDVTVRYGSGEQTQYVRGLTKVALCTAGGDSGGPWLWGTQAQGLTSGGANGDASAEGARCGAGDVGASAQAPAHTSAQAVAYFQPLAPVLAETGVVLDTEAR